MKEKKTEGNWQFDSEYASAIAILRAESIEPAGQHKELNPLDFLVISEHSNPGKLRFAFEANEAKSPIYFSRGWDVPFQIELGKSNPTTLNVVAGFVFPVNERNKNIKEVQGADRDKLKKALLKADYMEVSWEQGGKPVTAKFNLTGCKKAIKEIVSKSRRARITNSLSSIVAKYRTSTAEKVLSKHKRKYKEKETHINGRMADELKEIVVKHEGLRGVRYWEFEDYSCIYDLEKGKLNYLGEKISPLWYDHKGRPYGTGERRPNIDGLRYYIPIADKEHRTAIAESVAEELRKSEALSKELNAKLQKDKENLKRELMKIYNASLWEKISWFLGIYKIFNAWSKLREDKLDIDSLDEKVERFEKWMEKLGELIERFGNLIDPENLKDTIREILEKWLS